MQRVSYTFPLYNLPPELKIFQMSFLFFLPFQLDKIKVGGDSCYPHISNKVSSSYYSVHLWSTYEINSQPRLSLTQSRENIRILASAISRAPLKHKSIKNGYPQC